MLTSTGRGRRHRQLLGLLQRKRQLAACPVHILHYHRWYLHACGSDLAHPFCKHLLRLACRCVFLSCLVRSLRHTHRLHQGQLRESGVQCQTNRRWRILRSLESGWILCFHQCCPLARLGSCRHLVHTSGKEQSCCCWSRSDGRDYSVSTKRVETANTNLLDKTCYYYDTATMVSASSCCLSLLIGSANAAASSGLVRYLAIIMSSNPRISWSWTRQGYRTSNCCA